MLRLVQLVRVGGGSQPLRELSSRRTSFYGPVQKIVEDKLHSAFSPIHLEVTNESHGKIENESHFHVFVVAEVFRGKKLLAKHRMVNGVFTTDEANLPFHSLRITAKTPEEWSAIGGTEAPAPPQCKGGDGLGLERR